MAVENKSTRRRLILDALENKDWSVLRELSIAPKGLEAARLEAWYDASCCSIDPWIAQDASTGGL